MPPLMNHTVFVSRLTKSSADADKEQYTTHSGYLGPGQISTAAVKVNIQPASAEVSMLVGGVFGKTFNCYTNCSGIVETMRLTMSGTGEEYFVRGRQKHDNGILPATYELILTKDKR